MIRTKILEDVKEWLEDTNYNIDLDDIINDFRQNDNISFTKEEVNAIDEMFIDEWERRYEKPAEMERELENLMIKWESERRYQETEWRLDRLG